MRIRLDDSDCRPFAFTAVDHRVTERPDQAERATQAASLHSEKKRDQLSLVPLLLWVTWPLYTRKPPPQRGSPVVGLGALNS